MPCAMPSRRVGKDGTVETVDEGVTDKRLMLVTEEFVGALSVMERPGNTLSPVLRDAWGTARLQTLTKNSPTKATGSHISIIAHTTDEELRARLTRIEMANGFANRFIFAKVRRSKLLPYGGHLDEQALDPIGEGRERRALEKARTLGRLTMSAGARRRWERVYRVLSGERPGLLGAVLGRAEAQVIRLAVIYAALDNSTAIDAPHLEAALAVWEFCETSATQIFGDLVGDAVADAIKDALRAASPNGMTRTEISALFQRHATRRGSRPRSTCSGGSAGRGGVSCCRADTRSRPGSRLRGPHEPLPGPCPKGLLRTCETRKVRTRRYRIARDWRRCNPEAATNSHNSQFARSQRPYATRSSRSRKFAARIMWIRPVGGSRSRTGSALWACGASRPSLWLDRSRPVRPPHAPANPHPSYSRLSRYDATGFVWLLQGRPVVALTVTTAAIESPRTGSVPIYRKHNKPGYGPLGDSLEDLK